MIFRIRKSVIKKFLKIVENEDLFPGKVILFKKISNKKWKIFHEKHVKRLNARKEENFFVERVMKRMNRLDVMLKKMIKNIKEDGLENDKNQLVLKESNLQRLLDFSDKTFEQVVEHGVQKRCLERVSRNEKIRIILVNEFDNDKKEQELLKEKSNEESKEQAKILFGFIKEHGELNEQEQYVCKEENVKEFGELHDEEYQQTIDFCISQGNLKVFKKESKTYILLISERFSDDLLKKLISLMKDEDEETEEGLLHILESQCIEKLKIKNAELENVIKFGIEKKALKQDIFKGNKILCYLKERRVKTDI